MFPTLMVTFREGVEAFLVIAVTFAYLKKTQRLHLVAALKWGVIAALAVSAVFGVGLVRAGTLTAVTEGWLALAALILVVSCTAHMMNNGPRLGAGIHARIEAADAAHPAAAQVGVFMFVLLMISREGVETATMLAAIAANARSGDLLIGGVLGTVAAAALSLTWAMHGKKINLAKFFQVTALFMMLFAIQLAIYAFHEFTEGGTVPGIDNARWHLLTEPWGPDGRYGAWLSYSLGLVPASFIAITALARHLRATVRPTSLLKNQK
ncbi:iron permease FTR1 [Duganella sp. FT135W]|uniref:Iron permease FTR1 n=1 Tax=Duganella flavida TaxID=2692175 RepID=A0A6L8K6P8_9BURK|nr:FTR1 family protein [Duganella flavida]MYM22635.1 iron permease FTR1 [Duganella flavida]